MSVSTLDKLSYHPEGLCECPLCASGRPAPTRAAAQHHHHQQAVDVDLAELQETEDAVAHWEQE